MHWFIDPIKNQYADFSGRATRQEFWMFILWYVLTYVGVSVAGFIIGLEELALLYSLAILVPGLAITARRLHDTGLSGWWQLVGIIPLLGLIVIIILTIREGEAGPNKYGANPLGGQVAEPAPEAMPATHTAEPENIQQGYGQ